MTPDDQTLYKGFKEMQQAALREGSHDRAKRFEQRMAALEAKTWGPVSSSAAASSSGSSSGDSASNVLWLLLWLRQSMLKRSRW